MLRLPVHTPCTPHRFLRLRRHQVRCWMARTCRRRPRRLIQLRFYRSRCWSDYRRCRGSLWSPPPMQSRARHCHRRRRRLLTARGRFCSPGCPEDRRTRELLIVTSLTVDSWFGLATMVSLCCVFTKIVEEPQASHSVAATSSLPSWVTDSNAAPPCHRSDASMSIEFHQLLGHRLRM